MEAARKLFGELAVQKGYCSRKELKTAQEKQRDMAAHEQHPKMLGLILLQEGTIDNTQFIDLLMELDKIVHDEPL